MAPPDFFPVGDVNSEISLIDWKGTADWIAFGPEVFERAFSSSGWKTFSVPSGTTSCCLFPMGRAGKLLWEGLPLELALVIASVRPEAICVFSRDSLRRRTESGSGSFSLATLLRENDSDQFALQAAVETTAVAPDLSSLVLTSFQIPRDAKTFVESIDNTALKAGVVQVFGDLDWSHELAQSIEGQGRPRNGDYWHAIFHRREPDYGNACYWFRNVGRHPVFPALAEQARDILTRCPDEQAGRWLTKLTAAGWDPFSFVDLCRECENEEDSALGIAARRIQWAEMLLLLSECAHQMGS